MTTDYLPDSPVIARAFCPRCEPEADQTTEILDTRWCETHAPRRDGLDDEAVIYGNYLSGSAESGGDENRAWCDFLHRGEAA